MLFNRKVKVSIGPKGEESVVIDQSFRIVFSVFKSLKSDVNSSQVAIYNLSENTRNRILKDNQILIIEAGYETTIETLSVMEIIRANNRNEVPDIVTIIEAVDGLDVNKPVSISLEGKNPVDTVLQKTLTDLDLPVKNTGVPVEGDYINGVSFSGVGKDILSEITKKAGLSWSIQDGEFQLLKPGISAEGRGVKLNKTTGLVGTPEKITNSEEDFETETGAGYIVRSLLNPKIRPGELIEIESREVSGLFRISSVEHYGDTEGQEYLTEAEVYEES